MNKKLLFITYTHSLGGGAEKILTNIVNGLAAQTDYEISVLEYARFQTKNSILNDEIKVLKPVVDMSSSSRIERIFKMLLVHIFPCILRKIYYKDNYDTVISFNYQIPSFLTPFKKSVDNIQWIHGDIYDLKSKPFKRMLQSISFKKADKIVAISENTKKSILDIFPQYKEKIRTIYNGTDVKLIEELSDAPTDIKLKENSMIFLGRLEPNKNPLKLIKYTERLIKEGMNVNLYLLGTGVQQEEVIQYINSIGMEDRIKALGYISEPYPIIRQSRAVCLLSESEGFPTVLTEGLALGKPFISTKIGGVRELSNNGKCGIIVNDYKDFKKAVSDIIFDDTKYAQMTTDCKEHIKLFSYNQQIGNIIKLIEHT